MRIFEKEKRLRHSKATIDYFMSNEYDYYAQNNTREFSYECKEYSAMYKRLNVQLMVTKECPFNCPFCIEKANAVGLERPQFEAQLISLKKVLNALKLAECEPTVSITGGEPTLYPEYLAKLNAELKGEVQYNLNTAGVNPMPEFERVNLSVHRGNVVDNAAAFGVLSRDDYWNRKEYENATIQKVLDNTSLALLESFLSNFKQKRFSIRFPSQTEKDDSIEWKYLFDKIEESKEWVFVQQKIGDYYWFEEWRYHDKLVRFSFSSLTQLQYYKTRNKYDESKLVRAVIILPNGDVKFDWISE